MNITREDLIEILRNELKDRPNDEQVKKIVKEEIDKALLPYATRDETKQLIKEALKPYPTRVETKKMIDSSLKEWALRIIETIENFADSKVDKTEHDKLVRRVEKLEIKVMGN